jgi:hypothetical protein
MGIPTSVVAAPGRIILIEDIPGKTRLRVRDSAAVNLLDHYTPEEIAKSNAIATCIVNGWLIAHSSTMDLPKEREYRVEIPEGKLVKRTFQNVGIKEVKTPSGTSIETVVDEEEAEDIRKKVSGMTASVDSDTTGVSEMEEGERISGEEESAPVSRLEKRRMDAAREQLEKTKPDVVVTGDPNALELPSFSVTDFIAMSERQKLLFIRNGGVSNPKNLRSIRDRKINHGKYFSVQVRKVAGEKLQEMES